MHTQRIEEMHTQRIEEMHTQTNRGNAYTTK